MRTPRDDNQAVRPWRALLRWLVRLGPLGSWLVVMAVIVGLSLLGFRWLAWLLAVAWFGYAAYTWIVFALRRRVRRRP